MKEQDFSKARHGDRVFVWDGPVADEHDKNASIDRTDGMDYPVLVTIDEGKRRSFTFTGYEFEDNPMPALFWSKPDFDPPPPPKRMKKVWVGMFVDENGDIWPITSDGDRIKRFNAKEQILNGYSGYNTILTAEVEVPE